MHPSGGAGEGPGSTGGGEAAARKGTGNLEWVGWLGIELSWLTFFKGFMKQSFFNSKCLNG